MPQFIDRPLLSGGLTVLGSCTKNVLLTSRGKHKRPIVYRAAGGNRHTYPCQAEHEGCCDFAMKRLSNNGSSMIHTKNLVQAALLIALMLAVPKAFPSIRANTCKTCYVHYETVNVSWSATTETFQGGVVGPWKHAPGMLGILPSGTSSGDGCSGNCATQSPVTGDRYILKGGVVWPYTTLPWLFSANGTSSTQKYGCAGPGCIYVGNAIGAGLSAWNKGIVNSIVLTRDLGGWNPASPPTIACSGGGGSGAAATPLVIPASSNDPLIATFIYHINLTAQGSGYTSAPNCAISGGGGSATLAADIDRAVIDAGATQSNPPHWPVDGSRTPYCPGVSNYDIVS